MSTEIEVLQAEVAALHAEVKALTLEADEQGHMLAARMEEYLERSLAAGQAGVKRVDDLLRAWSEALYAHFSAALKNDFHKDVAATVAAQVTSDTIADSLSKGLSKRVLITRQASREEMRDGGNVLITRNATREEISKQ